MLSLSPEGGYLTVKKGVVYSNLLMLQKVKEAIEVQDSQLHAPLVAHRNSNCTGTLLRPHQALHYSSEVAYVVRLHTCVITSLATN